MQSPPLGCLDLVDFGLNVHIAVFLFYLAFAKFGITSIYLVAHNE